VKLIVPYPPSSNRYWRHIVMRGRAITLLSREAREYKKEVSLMLSGIQPLSGAIRFTATVFRPRRAGDLMNREKVLSDALQGFAFHDDKQIVESHWYLRDDKDNPRVEVEVDVIDGTRELF
jgi:crossover junction endodeoxyribonuclease RusA